MRVISYLRVSTDKQGLTGYGIDAQRAAILNHVKGDVLAEYVEVESGKSDSRPQLLKALAHCKQVKAILVIAKLDRLSRKVSFVANMIDSGVDFICCDNPHATKFTLQLLAVMAEYERDMISKRTKEGLAAAKARGVVLGGLRGDSLVKARIEAKKMQQSKAFAFASSVYLNVKDALSQGGSFYSAAKIMNERGIATFGGCLWNCHTVKRTMERMAA